MSFSFSLFLPSVFSFPCRRSKGARVPKTPCLFGNQTAVFLKCAEIDCALESAKKPRTAGLCGRAAGACDCGLLSCSTIERVNKGQKPPEQGMVRRKNTLPKGSFLHRRSRIHTNFSHIAHKRRNTRFKGLRRVHTPPQPLTAHTAAHTAKHGGETRSRPMWGGSAVWNRSGQAQLHLFFLLRFFNPVQQVLRFFQCPRHVVENRAPFRALSAQGCFKQIPYIIQCFRAGSMHG